MENSSLTGKVINAAHSIEISSTSYYGRNINLESQNIKKFNSKNFLKISQKKKNSLSKSSEFHPKFCNISINQNIYNLRYENINEENKFNQNENQNVGERSNNDNIFFNKNNIKNIDNPRNINNRLENQNSTSSEEIDQIFARDYKKFYEDVKKLVIPDNINNEEINTDRIIDEIKKLISNNEKKNVNDIAKNEKFQGKILSNNNINNLNDDFVNINSELINENDNINQKNIYSLNTNLNNTLNFLPESISPQNMYKIFIYCIKNFEYEEKIYNKFLTIEDLEALKSFAKKLPKYIRNLSTSISSIKKKKQILIKK